MKHYQIPVIALLFLGSLTTVTAQTNDATTPLHLMKPIIQRLISFRKKRI